MNANMLSQDFVIVLVIVIVGNREFDYEYEYEWGAGLPPAGFRCGWKTDGKVCACTEGIRLDNKGCLA